MLINYTCLYLSMTTGSLYFCCSVLFLWSCISLIHIQWGAAWGIVIIKRSPTYSVALHYLSCVWSHCNKGKWKPCVKLKGLTSSTSDMHICKQCFKLNVFLFLVLKNSRHRWCIVPAELQTFLKKNYFYSHNN